MRLLNHYVNRKLTRVEIHISEFALQRLVIIAWSPFGLKLVLNQSV